MSKKRTQQTEAAAPPKLCIDYHNMVALRSSNGALFLVDKNCAMVSKTCREYIQRMEALLSSAGEEEHVDSQPNDSVQRSQLVKHNTPARHSDSSGGGMTEVATPTSTLQEQIPFCCLEGPEEVLLSVGQLLREHQKTSAEMSTPQEAPQQPQSSGRGHTSAHRRASIAPTRLQSSPFAAMDDPDTGFRFYPMIDLPDISSELLELGICFMYHKYRSDCSPELRAAPFSEKMFNEPDPTRLISVGITLGL